MAADEHFRNATEFVDGQEMLAKLGSESTLEKFGGQVVAQTLAPTNLDDCIDFDEYARNNSISDMNIEKAKTYYAKLGLSTV